MKKLLLFFALLPLVSSAQKIDVGISGGYNAIKLLNAWHVVSGPYGSVKAQINIRRFQLGIGEDIGMLGKRHMITIEPPGGNSYKKEVRWQTANPYYYTYAIANYAIPIRNVRVYAGINLGYMIMRSVVYKSLREGGMGPLTGETKVFTTREWVSGLQLGTDIPLTRKLKLNAQIGMKNVPDANGRHNTAGVGILYRL